jgi:hypothetical protein
LQAGRVTLWRAPVDLRDVLARAVHSIEPLVVERQQSLSRRPISVAGGAARSFSASSRAHRGRIMTAVCNTDKAKRILAYMFDEKEFLSP